ncbi:DUF4307 domain-containing protein [Isoptericola sp. NEAU-Y5]|uniref:DUF4307 domain-containing protein n=1 Tax=Isoptericola luteus TaxID=2879484 RepID=A0ABS7ZCQ7_9MICO|nr:DUF4307 domain-containing protein [Isoptericola sp. NEAU-Y5]MCA5892817.1 DUF4307 domain-containing protein [Isoptericola sp. NEAU-Y5]
MSAPTESTPPADRYGTRPARRPSGRLGKVAVVVALAAAVGLVAWFTIADQRSNPVTGEMVAFDVPGPEQAQATFQVHMPAGTTAVCALEAQSTSHAQVGTLEVPVGPSEATTSTYTVTVQTSEEATTVVIDGCTPTD